MFSNGKRKFNSNSFLYTMTKRQFEENNRRNVFREIEQNNIESSVKYDSSLNIYDIYKKTIWYIHIIFYISENTYVQNSNYLYSV